METINRSTLPMETRMVLVEDWSERHDRECNRRWGVLVGLAVSLILALLTCTFILARMQLEGQQRQIDEIRAVSVQVDKHTP